MSSIEKTRLDQYLVDREYYASRSRARDAIVRGCVKVDGKTLAKPGSSVVNAPEIEIDDAAIEYVSRSALKLVHALAVSKFQVSGKTCLDIGASTGGFTQVLLAHGATRVFALDVGHNQLVEKIKSDPRVTELSGINAKEIDIEMLQYNHPDLIVCDVSFISLKKALPRVLELAKKGANAVFLIKPQFEVGREYLGKNGLVQNETHGYRVAQDIVTWLNEYPAWRVTDFIDSPLRGGDGNREYLAIAEKR